MVPCLFALACSASQARIVRNVGRGVVVEGAGVALVSEVTRDPDDRRAQPLITAAPLLIGGALLASLGYVLVWIAE